MRGEAKASDTFFLDAWRFLAFFGEETRKDWMGRLMIYALYL